MYSFQRINILFKNMSIRSKLIIAFTFLLVGICIFIFIYFPSKFEEQSIKHISDLAESISMITAYSIEPSLFFMDEKDIGKVIQNTKQNKNIEYIVLLNTKEETVICENCSKAREVDFLKVGGTNSFSSDGMIYKYYTPVNHENVQIGKLYLGLSTREVIESINESRASIAISSIILFIIGIIFIIGISNILAKPITRLSKTIELISEGDLSQRAIINSKDEIGLLAHTFDIMVDKLEEAYQELKQEIIIRKETELELINAKEEISLSLEIEKKLNDLKTRFVSMVSHEYRTPLTIILSSTYLLDIFYKKQLTSDFNKQLSIIQDTVDNLVKLLDDILIISRSDAGKLKVESKPLNIVSLIDGIILQTSVIDKNKHKFTFNYDNDNLIINSDEYLMQQIINNLISNALKYSPKDSFVKMNLEDNQEKIILTINDDGIGIPNEDQVNLFDSFFRAKNTTGISGTGLGLAIVKRYVDALGGKISFQSNVNQGTTFHVEIPKNHT